MNREMKLKVLTVFPLISEVISLIFMPSEIPVHYDGSFEVTSYGSKYMLLGLGVTVLLFGLFMNWIYKSNADTEWAEVVYRLSVIALVVFNCINVLSLIGAFYNRGSIC